MDSEPLPIQTVSRSDSTSVGHARSLSSTDSEDDIATQLLSTGDPSDEHGSLDTPHLFQSKDAQELPSSSAPLSVSTTSSGIFEPGPPGVPAERTIQQFIDYKEALLARGLTSETSPELRKVCNLIQEYESQLQQNHALYSSDNASALKLFHVSCLLSSQSSSSPKTTEGLAQDHAEGPSTFLVKQTGPAGDILNETMIPAPHIAGEDVANPSVSAPAINQTPESNPARPDSPIVQDNESQSAAEGIKSSPINPSQEVNAPIPSNLSESETIPVPLPATSSESTNPEATQHVPLPPNYPPVVYPPILPDNNMDVQFVMWNESAPGDSDMVDISTEDEDDSMDDDDDEDDASSEVSEGNDLKGDLESALEGDFDFQGNFAFSTSLPQAPNPGLQIEPLGLIGLPLSPRDALLIKNCAMQAPFGHGERTVVDKEVRDTWEIEPAKVQFANLEWLAFVTGDVVKRACAELGVSVQTSMPRCELYKLLLYETGSHFLPHQDTEKTLGMFATVIIVLPSSYTGGQVHVSHSASSRVYDLAPSSAFTTSMLSWYTDVTHEVKPVTSGYRLALSYNLVHTKQGIPRPMLPDMHSAVTALRSVLRRWGKGGYDCAEDTPQIVAYLLKHQYSEVNLKACALKGEDAHKISHLQTLAEESDIVVCLANLSYNVSGVADDNGCGYYGGYGGRKRNRYYDEDRGTPPMLEEIDRTLTISNLVDLNGREMMSGREMHLDDESLIPENPFEDSSPDRTEYEGYMGNGAGTLDYWYKRTVLVLFREEEGLDILLSAGGIAYALQTLNRSGAATRSPTADDTKMVNYILSRLTPNDKTTARSMADFAVQWGDSEMWKKVAKGSSAEKNVDVLGEDNLIRAWKKFSFEVVRPTLEEILMNIPTLQAQFVFTTSLQLEATGDDVDVIAKWCNEQTSRALSSLKTPTKGDVPIFISVLLGKGFAFLPDLILPQLVKMPSIYEFWVAFIASLHSHKNALLRPMQPAPAEQNSGDATSSAPDAKFETVLGQCLGAAVMQWNSTVAQPRPSYPYSAYGNPSLQSQGRITRITNLVGLCITTGHLAPCARLFVLIIKSSEGNNLSDKFQKLFNPLITELKTLLSSRGIDLASQPFGEFFRVLIGSYLRGILGAKGQHVQTGTIPKVIGCTCLPCADLDRFMASTAAEYTFRYKQTQRDHLERRLNVPAARELVNFRTIRSGSPYGLVVTKRPAVVAATRWSHRQKQAKIFLSSIGSDAVISKLMGTRYPDVVKSLEGVQLFSATSRDAVSRPQPLAPSSAANTPQASTSTSVTGVTPPSAAPVLSSTSSNKRKRPGPAGIALGPVIDLTGDDSP